MARRTRRKIPCVVAPPDDRKKIVRDRVAGPSIIWLRGPSFESWRKQEVRNVAVAGIHKSRWMACDREHWRRTYQSCLQLSWIRDRGKDSVVHLDAFVTIEFIQKKARRSLDGQVKGLAESTVTGLTRARDVDVSSAPIMVAPRIALKTSISGPQRWGQKSESDSRLQWCRLLQVSKWCHEFVGHCVVTLQRVLQM